MHLDLHVPEAERAAEVDRLIALGASKLYVVTVADPEGNEFCVA